MQVSIGSANFVLEKISWHQKNLSTAAGPLATRVPRKLVAAPLSQIAGKRGAARARMACILEADFQG